jgi:hypothetical protein
MLKVNFSDSVSSLPGLDAPHSTGSKQRRNSIEGSDIASNFRRIRELEAENNTLKNKVTDAETKYLNLCAFLQNTVAEHNKAEALLLKKNEELQCLVNRYNLQGELNCTPAKPVALKPRDMLFQSPKAPALKAPSAQSPSARIYMGKGKI